MINMVESPHRNVIGEINNSASIELNRLIASKLQQKKDGPYYRTAFGLLKGKVYGLGVVTHLPYC